MAYDVHLADRVRSILKSAVEFSEKKMFGGLTFMVNGQMCCGVLKTDLVLRLTPEQVVASLDQPHIRPMDFTGKPMKSMVYVSAPGTDSDQALAALVESAVAIARTLPKAGDERRPHGRSTRASSSVVTDGNPVVAKSAPGKQRRTRA